LAQEISSNRLQNMSTSTRSSGLNRCWLLVIGSACCLCCLMRSASFFQPAASSERKQEGGQLNKPFMLQSRIETEELVAVDHSPLSVTDGSTTLTIPTSPAAYYWWAIILYMFYVMSIVCDDYLVPAVDCICEKMRIPDDVAGATLVAFACNGPELLTNTCSIFLTKTSVGMGTIVGSAIFNVLVITGSCPIVSPDGKLRVQPLSFFRDASFSAVSIAILWWALPVIDLFKATVLLSMSIVYVVAVSYTQRYTGETDTINCDDLTKTMLESNNEQLDRQASNNEISKDEESLAKGEESAASHNLEIMQRKRCPVVTASHPISIGGFLARFLSSPTGTLLAAIIPDVKLEQKKHLCFLAFFLSMLWLSTTAYVVCLGSDQINKDWGIPQSFLGLTLVAVGTSWPNLIASMITARDGRGSMAVSNALGSNVQNVFFVLAFPIWVRVLLSGPYVMSGADILSSVIWMGITLAFCVVITVWNQFHITTHMGWCCMALYAIYLLQATLSP